jgi:ADP-ribosylglycohydrolase
MKNKIFLVLFLFAFDSTQANVVQNEKTRGLLWGSLYGDAFGGPYEFQKVKYHKLISKNKVLSSKDWKVLAQSINLVDYKIPSSSYGPWRSNAPKGTITDDSRHKIILWNSYLTFGQVSKIGLAKSYIHFYLKSKNYKAWLAEYVRAAYFVADSGHKLALPLERLWGGMATQAGQMIFLPMAIIGN